MPHHLVPLPKSKTPSRIHENSLVFDFYLDGSDMENLDSLNENLRTCWHQSLAHQKTSCKNYNHFQEL